MNIEEVCEFLTIKKNYLELILSRFIRSINTLHIRPEDGAKFSEIILDLKGFFSDEFINSNEYIRPMIAYFNNGTMYGSASYHAVEGVKGVVSAAIDRVRRNPAVLKDGESGASRTLRAYEGLDLHPEIARVASSLYRDGHFANAVENSVKALNGLVRLRSDLELDGVNLMERAFSVKNPVLRFNNLANESDSNEQKGFMQLFSGAVSGLRNPRAHGFVNDSPERALEFIAFVSLLAKLLDGASRADQT